MGCGSSKSVESVVSSGNTESKLNIQDANENSDIEVEENDQIKLIKETEPRTKKESVFSVGDKVHVSGYTGVVKFFGPLGDQGDEWVGIELDRQHSQGNDGRFQGVQHFTCKPKHGLFSRASLVVRYSGLEASKDDLISLQTIVFIQRSIRSYLANVRLKKFQKRS